MKKLLVVLVLGLGLFLSCTNETNVYIDSQKMDVLLNPKTSSNTASKGVDRGDIYVWVEDINVSVTEQSTGGVINEVFTLTDNAGDASEFIIEDVPVGTNIFNATTTTNGNSINTHYAVNNNTDLNIYTAMNPFAIYNSGDEPLFVSSDSSNELVLDMTTQNGRLISHFKLAKNGYSITIKTSTDGVLTNTTTVLNNNTVTAYLSNSDAVDGLTRQHVITIQRPNSSEVLNTYIIDEVVSSSVSKSNTYEIGINEVFVSSSSLSFTWQEWTEESN